MYHINLHSDTVSPFNLRNYFRRLSDIKAISSEHTSTRLKTTFWNCVTLYLLIKQKYCHISSNETKKIILPPHLYYVQIIDAFFKSVMLAISAHLQGCQENMLVTLISEAYHIQVTIIYSILYSVKCKLTYLCPVYANETLPGETAEKNKFLHRGSRKSFG